MLMTKKLSTTLHPMVVGLMLLLVAAQPCEGRTLIRTSPGIFEVMSWGMNELASDWNSDYHRDVIDHFGRQFRCAQTCAERNREIRNSAISNARVSIESSPQDSGPLTHSVTVALPGVDSKDIQVTTHGDVLSIKATREWKDEFFPEISEEVKSCNCQDLAKQLLGKKDEYSQQLRLPSSVAKDRISVSFQKDSGVLVVKVPEKEPETFKIDVVEVQEAIANNDISDTEKVEASS